MKEIFYKIARQSKRPGYIAVYAAIAILAVGSVLYIQSKGATVKAETSEVVSEKTKTESSLVSIVGINGLYGSDVSAGNSWPAEIISNNISQIQPQREGIISDWRVHIGEFVTKGQVLGKISAPPGTPELIQMLSEQTESLAMAKANAGATDEYVKKEQARLSGLRDSLSSGMANSDQIFTALLSMRENVKVKKNALRAFIERALAGHVAMVTNFTSWSNVRYGGLGRGTYGIFNQSVQNSYENSLLILADKLKSSADTPIAEAQEYFRQAVLLANFSSDDASAFKTDTRADQKEFLEFLSDYREAEAEVSDKETEYKLMINEQSAMLEKEKAMAAGSLAAAEQAYSTVYREIKGEIYIKAPRTGTISAVYKKVGDLVSPMMAVALIAEKNDSNLIARIRMPNNIIRPKIGDVLSAVRPGFPGDVYEVKIVGVGNSLDETGSYMADAVFLKNPEWPVQSSIRVLPPKGSAPPIIASASLLWDEDGAPYVWSVSSGGRIYKNPVKVGRLLGTSVEIYAGLKDGDRYITNPNSEITENMLLDEIIDITADESGENTSGSEGQGSMPGMEM